MMTNPFTTIVQLESADTNTPYSNANPVPVIIGSGSTVTMADAIATGSITTQNLNSTGVGTTGSYVGFAGLSNKASCKIQVTGTYTGLLTVQASNDGVNWVAIGLNNPTTSIAVNNLTTQSIASAANGIYDVNIAGFNCFRVVALAAVTGSAVVTIQASGTSGNIVSSRSLLYGNGGATMDVVIGGATAGANAVQVGGVFRTTPLDLATTGYGAALSINSAASLLVDTEGQKTSYSVSGVIAPASAATSILTISGSSTKTVKIKRCHISCTATTAGTMQMSLNVRTSANTGGTSTAPTIGKLDSNNASATAVVAQYSANPSALGTLAYAIDNTWIDFGVAASGYPYDRSFGTSNQQAITLRGATQFLEIDLNAGTVPAGASIVFSVDWSEE